MAATALIPYPATISQIRWRAGMVSVAMPAMKVPTMNAAEPHRRTGP